MMRYQVIPKSLSAHCCFEATVVDLTRPCIIGKKQYVDSEGIAHFEPICECFDVADAELIAAAMNETAGHEKPKN